MRACEYVVRGIPLDSAHWSVDGAIAWCYVAWTLLDFTCGLAKKLDTGERAGGLWMEEFALNSHLHVGRLVERAVVGRNL